MLVPYMFLSRSLTGDVLFACNLPRLGFMAAAATGQVRTVADQSHVDTAGKLYITLTVGMFGWVADGGIIGNRGSMTGATGKFLINHMFIMASG